MQVRELEPKDIHVAASWLLEPENYQWLDFGAGKQILSPNALAIMRGREQHCLRVFTPDNSTELIGLVALSNIASAFRTGTLWYVLGDKRYAGRGYTGRAVARMLSIAFNELGLESVNAWVVEANRYSVRILEKNGFHLIGRQRKCHRIEEQSHDRLLYDILAGERPQALAAGQ